MGSPWNGSVLSFNGLHCVVNVMFHKGVRNAITKRSSYTKSRKCLFSFFPFILGMVANTWFLVTVIFATSQSPELQELPAPATSQRDSVEIEPASGETSPASDKVVVSFCLWFPCLTSRQCVEFQGFVYGYQYFKYDRLSQRL